MDEYDRDRLAEGFADLTALLEDAAALSVDGQSVERSLNEVRESAKCLRALLNASVTKLARIERHIERGDGK